MDDEQLKKNVAYVADCIRSVMEREKAAGNDYSMYANWLDFLEGREYAPGPGQVWSDVKQPPQTAEAVNE